MELKKRKEIRLRPYDYSRSNTYYITICTYARMHLFGEIVGGSVGAHLCVRPYNPHQMIEKWLYETERKYTGVKIDTHIIMPDHIHFILCNYGAEDEAGAHIGAPLHEIIKWFKTQTTNEYIQCVKRGLYPSFEKHVWQRNYYEHIIRNQQSMDEIRKYIADNPRRWINRSSP